MPVSAALSHFLSSYGLAAVVAGTFLEGETIVILAGFFAHQGFMIPWQVALAAFAGSAAGDQALFFLARRKGAALLRHFPRLAAGVRRMSRTMRRHEAFLILSFRFLYGLRNVTPVFLGLGRVRASLFVPLNLLGAAVWAALFTTVGYYSGEAVTRLFGRIEHIQILALPAALCISVLFWLLRRKKRPPPEG